MRFRFAFVTALLLTVILVFPGCAQTKCNLADWQDISWKLKSYGSPDNPQPVVGNNVVTIQFNSGENRISGSGGCNSYFGSYIVNNQTCEVEIKDVGSTKMACADAAVMQQEQKYFNLLQTAGKIELKDGELCITCGSELLVYVHSK